MLIARKVARGGPPPVDAVHLTSDERHLRRKALALASGGTLFVELASAIRLQDGERLVTDEGGHVIVVAAAEPLLEVRAEGAKALARIGWHLGNRHARVQLCDGAIRLLPDHVLDDMIRGLGGLVTRIEAPFIPEPPRLTGVPHHHAHD